ncbi:Bud site selection protein 6 [Smittium mucronatum]|uniref:Bud site selection protein 6 n=1 Tax=Smittium mucronatum TaxID=133383 RepID=A0A1R0H833_9FUNG|nr:Bud site selection protein 6 [Smittium mucronatum]
MESIRGFLSLSSNDDLPEFKPGQYKSYSKNIFRLQKKSKLKTGGENSDRSQSPSSRSDPKIENYMLTFSDSRDDGTLPNSSISEVPSNSRYLTNHEGNAYSNSKPNSSYKNPSEDDPSSISKNLISEPLPQCFNTNAIQTPFTQKIADLGSTEIHEKDKITLGNQSLLLGGGEYKFKNSIAPEDSNSIITDYPHLFSEASIINQSLITKKVEKENIFIDSSVEYQNLKNNLAQNPRGSLDSLPLPGPRTSSMKHERINNIRTNSPALEISSESKAENISPNDVFSTSKYPEKNSSLSNLDSINFPESSNISIRRSRNVKTRSFIPKNIQTPYSINTEGALQEDLFYSRKDKHKNRTTIHEIDNTTTKTNFQSENQFEGGESCLSPFSAVKSAKSTQSTQAFFEAIDTQKSVDSLMSNSSSDKNDVNTNKNQSYSFKPPISKVQYFFSNKTDTSLNKPLVLQARDAIAINGSPKKDRTRSSLEISSKISRKSRSSTSDIGQISEKRSSLDTLNMSNSSSNVSNSPPVNKSNLISIKTSGFNTTLSKPKSVGNINNSRSIKLFLQYGSRIKKTSHNGSPSIFSLLTLFLDAFEEDKNIFSEMSSTSFRDHKGKPFFLIKDPQIDIFYELVDLRDIKDNSIIKWNCYPSKNIGDDHNPSPQEIPQSFDYQILKDSYFEILKKISELPIALESMLVDSTNGLKDTLLSQISVKKSVEVHSPVSNKPTKELPEPTDPKKKDLEHENSLLTKEIFDLKEKLKKITYDIQISKSEKLIIAKKNSDLTKQLEKDRIKITSLEEKIQNLENSTSQSYNSNRKNLDIEKNELKSRYEELGRRMEALEIFVNELRKDVVVRKSTPTPRLISNAKSGLESILKDVSSLENFFNEVTPRWKSVWSDELKSIVSEQHLSKQIESEMSDLSVDAKSLLDILDKLNAVIELKQENGSSSASPQFDGHNLDDNTSTSGSSKSSKNNFFSFIGNNEHSENPVDLKKQILGEISLVNISSEERVEAIEISEKLRKFELDSRNANEFESELSEFIFSNKLKKTGGVEELEMKLEAKQASNLINMLSR